MILSLPSPFCQLKIKSTHKLKYTNSLTLYSHPKPDTLLLLTLHPSLIMPGPDPRKTKPSTYTIPKAGSSKSVGTRPPLHAAASATAKDDNPRPLTHQEVRRGKSHKPPAVSRTSARLPGSRRSPTPALKSRITSLKRPDKYDPKASSNLTQLGSKSSRLAPRQAPPTIYRQTDSPDPALVLSDSDDDVLLLNNFDGEENDESIEAIQEAIDQMGVGQPDSDFEMAAQAGSEYAYLLAGT